MPSPSTNANGTINANKAAQLAGHRNFPDFPLSYGLRIYNMDDVEEGKVILRGMGYKLD